MMTFGMMKMARLIFRKTSILTFMIRMRLMADRWFIDTGAWFARFYGRDNHHRESVTIWNFIEKENIIAVSTNHVLDELATLLARRTDYDYSGRKMEKIYGSDIRVERSSEKDELNALKFFRKYADQRVSFTDCLSFVIIVFQFRYFMAQILREANLSAHDWGEDFDSAMKIIFSR